MVRPSVPFTAAQLTNSRQARENIPNFHIENSPMHVLANFLLLQLHRADIQHESGQREGKRNQQRISIILHGEQY